MKQCEESLKINITYQNSIGNAAQSESEKGLANEISKIIQNANKQSTLVDPHVERLIDFY